MGRKKRGCLFNHQAFMKYAIVITFCEKYLYGFNALINGLDLYENHIDLFVLAENIRPEYLERLRNTNWCFKLTIEDFEEYRKKIGLNLGDAFSNAIYLPYYKMLELQDYDAVSFFGADQAICNNIEIYYEIAAKTDLILTTNNAWVLDCKGDYNPKVDYWFDMPLIVNPKIHKPLIEKIISYKDEKHSTINATNRALIDLKLMERVFPLPNQTWECGIVYDSRFEAGLDTKNRYMWFADRERINAIHKQWWKEEAREAYLWDKKDNQRAIDGVKMLQSIYDKLNKIGKLPYEDSFSRSI